jgi:hypothetical protein
MARIHGCYCHRTRIAAPAGTAGTAARFRRGNGGIYQQPSKRSYRNVYRRLRLRGLDRLSDDLIPVECAYDSSYALLLERKGDMCERGLASSDDGDALALQVSSAARAKARLHQATSRLGSVRNARRGVRYRALVLKLTCVARAWDGAGAAALLLILPLVRLADGWPG